MQFNTKNLASLLPGMLAAALIGVTSAQAAETRESTPGYVQSSGNNIISPLSGGPVG